jgi:lysyl-tRNA synthetase class 2
MKPNWLRLRSGELDWKAFEFRAALLRAARLFFEREGFLEVEPPLLTPFPTLDSNIQSIKADVKDGSGESRPFFLHTSPEHSMKKMLAAGAERIFYIGKVFRDGEVTALHNPEFTMAEWYRAGADLNGIMRDTEALVRFIAGQTGVPLPFQYGGRSVDLSAPFKRMTVRELFRDRAGVDLGACGTKESFSNAANKAGVLVEKDDDWETVFFRVFLEKIEPGLGFPSPVFVTEYPARMGLMARRKAGEPDWVERAELYMGGLELANGYTELTDAGEQRGRFMEELGRKRAQGFHDYRMDEELLQALELGLPPCAGIALGLDRLIMLFLDKKQIQDVLLFPF